MQNVALSKTESIEGYTAHIWRKVNSLIIYLFNKDKQNTDENIAMHQVWFSRWCLRNVALSGTDIVILEKKHRTEWKLFVIFLLCNKMCVCVRICMRTCVRVCVLPLMDNLSQVSLPGGISISILVTVFIFCYVFFFPPNFCSFLTKETQQIRKSSQKSYCSEEAFVKA